MKITALDGEVLNPGDLSWDGVAALGDLTVHARTGPEDLARCAAGADVVLTNKTRLTDADMTALPDLKLISVLATGFDVVDVDAASRRGIVVSNVPGYAARAVSQYALALILECCHRVSLHDAAVKAGEWTDAPDWCFWKSPQIELAGLTLGVVGLGAIGSRVARLGNALGMKVLAHVPRPKPAPDFSPFAFSGLDELFAKSHVVSLHCPLTPDNKGFVDKRLLSLMRPGAILVNTARGALVDEAALARALDSGRLGAAALDVVSQEPILPGNPLLKAKNCVITPHMAWASRSARQRIMDQTEANIRAFIQGNPANVVNPA